MPWDEAVVTSSLPGSLRSIWHPETLHVGDTGVCLSLPSPQ